MLSVVSLDLGGKNTGFFSFSSNDVSQIDNFQIDDFQSGTIIYDESFVLSQVGRRGKRHTKRNNLRNSLAKRLFLVRLIVQKKVKETFAKENAPQSIQLLYKVFAEVLLNTAMKNYGTHGGKCEKS